MPSNTFWDCKVPKIKINSGHLADVRPVFDNGVRLRLEENTKRMGIWRYSKYISWYHDFNVIELRLSAVEAHEVVWLRGDFIWTATKNISCATKCTSKLKGNEIISLRFEMHECVHWIRESCTVIAGFQSDPLATYQEQITTEAGTKDGSTGHLRICSAKSDGWTENYSSPAI